MGEWSLGFFMGKHCLVCVCQWAFSFSSFDLDVSKCLTDVAFVSFLCFSLVDSVWPKLQDVWWISYAKPHHHHWTRHNVNGHSATTSFPVSPSLISFASFSLSVTGHIPLLFYFFLLLPMKCFVPEVLITCLQKEKKKNKRKTYCNRLLCTLSKQAFPHHVRVILNHCDGATGNHSVAMKPSSLRSH